VVLSQMCPPGQFQQQEQQSACVDCPENHDCSSQGWYSLPQTCDEAYLQTIVFHCNVWSRQLLLKV
jgi:hypothetical protein